MFQQVLQKAQEFDANINIKFKNESYLFYILSKILFFNKEFMTAYATTIGKTIYFPSKEYIQESEERAVAMLAHEALHIYDETKLTKYFFGFLYLFPQILSLLAIPLFFFNYNICALLCLLFLLPLPAPFRMMFEKRAYLVQLYILYYLKVKYKYNIDLNERTNRYINNFTSANYYFMFPFKSQLQEEFELALAEISVGFHPFESDFFHILDKMLEK